MGPLSCKRQFRTLNHYDSRWIVCDQSVCVCVCLKRSSTCLSHVLPHGLALPPDFQLLHAQNRTHTHTQFYGPVGQLWDYYAARELSDGSLKGRFVLCLPRLDPPFNYASIIWLAESMREWAFKGLFTLSVYVRLSAPLCFKACAGIKGGSGTLMSTRGLCFDVSSAHV